MALNIRTAGDYYLLGFNQIPGRPKVGWTPVDGQFVVRSPADGDNVFDLAADSQVPVGMVISTNGTTGTIGVALFVPGVTIIVPVDLTTGTDLNDQIQTTALGLVNVGTSSLQRSQCKAVASGGIGSIIDLAPWGSAGGVTTTATVEIWSI